MTAAGAPTLTLCATELQARLLRARHHREQRRAGHGAWVSPPILSLPRWARETWLQSWPAEQLLSRTHELWLWESLISEHPECQALLSTAPLARQFRASWQHCLEWGIEPGAAPLWTREQKLFAELFNHYQERLRQRNWITDAQLPAVIRAAIEHGELQPPPATNLWCLAPEQQCARDRGLLAQLPKTASITPVAAAAGPPPAWSCPAGTELWRHVAQRALHLLRPQPQATLVVGVSQLRQHLGPLDAGWLEVLAPELLGQAQTSGETPWLIEQPTSLGEQAAVAALRDLMALRPGNMEFTTVAAVLRQPLFFSDDERPWALAAEQSLRTRGLRFGARDLYQALPGDAPEPLAARLRALSDTVEHEPGLASTTDWLQHWRERWRFFDAASKGRQWPLLEELEQALLEFNSLGAEIGSVGQSRASYWLGQILADKRYSPRRRREARVLVCELDQALGLPADGQLLVGLDAQQLPAPRRQSPWLNPALLMEAGDPAATATTHLAQQRQQLEQTLAQSAQCEVWTSPSDERGAELQPTPLLALDWQSVVPDGPDKPPLATLWRDDDGVPALSEQRIAAQRGATKLLRAQAHSPFFAFINHRLQAESLEAEPTGLSARVQGEWVHELLADFWRAQSDSATLASLDDEAVSALVQAQIGASENTYLPAARFGAGLRALERDRVLKLCTRWLAHERKRADPFEVLHCESSVRERRLGFGFKLRIDRLDLCHTPAGKKYLVIDYKTGAVELKGWKAEKLREPQLPLYATSTALAQLDVPRVDGICFARVDEHHPALVAATNWCQKLSEADDKGWKGEWATEHARWQAVLEGLLRDYAAGVIGHDPKAVEPYGEGLLFLVDQALGGGEDDDG